VLLPESILASQRSLVFTSFLEVSSQHRVQFFNKV
jgi:hypothetical protein